MHYFHKIDHLSSEQDVKGLENLFNTSPELFFTSQYSFVALNNATTGVLDFWLELHLKHGIELKYDFGIFKSCASIKFWYNAITKYDLPLPEIKKNSRIKITEMISDDHSNDHVANECNWGKLYVSTSNLIECFDIMYELYNDKTIFTDVFSSYTDHNFDVLKWFYSKDFSPDWCFCFDFEEDIADFCQNNLIPNGWCFLSP